MEAGATRNFMALKLAEEQAARELQAEKEDEANNPMKVIAWSCDRSFSERLNACFFFIFPAFREPNEGVEERD